MKEHLKKVELFICMLNGVGCSKGTYKMHSFSEETVTETFLLHLLLQPLQVLLKGIKWTFITFLMQKN